MDLLIVRHGVAEDKEAFAETRKSDDERPLTDKGRKKMKRAARGLRSLVPEIGLLAASPLVRARETAEIVAAAYDLDGDVDVADELRPGSSFDAFDGWLRRRANQSLVCVVGHEPHLSGLATWLMSGAKESQLELGKGGACLLSFSGAPTRGGAILCWLMTSKQLERIGER
jgi:phosphohistidine phosphatase